MFVVSYKLYLYIFPNAFGKNVTAACKWSRKHPASCGVIRFRQQKNIWLRLDHDFSQILKMSKSQRKFHELQFFSELNHVL